MQSPVKYALYFSLKLFLVEAVEGVQGFIILRVSVELRAPQSELIGTKLTPVLQSALKKLEIKKEITCSAAGNW